MCTNDLSLIEGDGSIEYKQLTSEYVEGAWDVMSKAFLSHENVCIAVNLPENPEAIAEFKEPTIETMKDGVSLVAVDRNTNRVVGIAINKLGVKDATPGTSFGKNLREKQSLGVLEFMTRADELCNFFDHCKVDCLLEIVFLATLCEFRGKGIGKNLCVASIELAKKLSQNGKLGLEPIPEIVTAIFTSFKTQKIGKQLGFQIVAEERYDQLEYQGRKYSDIIEKETPVYTVEYLRIK